MILPHPQCLMVSSPSPLHEFIVTHLMDELSCTMWTIPLPKSLSCQPAANKSFNKKLIEGIPDLTVNMWSSHNTELWRVLLRECAFTQSDDNVNKKLQAYVLDAPDILVICKILIKQGDHYCNPDLKLSVAKGLWWSHLLTWTEFSSVNAGDFMQTVIDDHTWLSLSSMEIHIWVRQLSGCDIKLDCLHGDGYAVRMCCLIPCIYIYHTDSH